MTGIAQTPDPPYYAVIFTSTRTTDGNDAAYAEMAERMVELATQQDGFLGIESVGDAAGTGITVSYWRDLNSIQNWRSVAEHREAQRLGKEKWYAQFQLRVCRLEKEYGWQRSTEKSS